MFGVLIFVCGAVSAYCSFINPYGAIKQEAISEDPDPALYLTPLIEQGNIQQTRESDKVTYHGFENNGGTTTTLSTLTASRFDHEVEKGEHSRRDLIVLNVYYPPVVTVHPSKKTVNETDKNVLLKCSYSGNPEPLEDALWAKDGKNITLHPEKYEGGVVWDLSLLIKYITREDHGNYSCFCENIVGSQESEKRISLNVLYPPTVELEMLCEQKSFTLVCNVTQGNPSTLQKVKWFLNDELLSELPQCNYSSYDKKGKGEGYGGPFCDVHPHVLKLVNVTESFAGNYTCQGRTVAGWGPKSEPQELEVDS